jgi:hypothetical protein
MAVAEGAVSTEAEVAAASMADRWVEDRADFQAAPWVDRAHSAEGPREASGAA